MAGWPLAAAKRKGEFQIFWPLQPLKQKGNFNIPASAGGGRNRYVFQIWKENDGRRIDRAIQLLTVTRKLMRPEVTGDCSGASFVGLSLRSDVCNFTPGRLTRERLTWGRRTSRQLELFRSI